MNKAKLKTYAPQARRDFIQMIRQRTDLLGLTKKEIEKPEARGEIALIEGRPYPKRYAELHKRLAEKIKTEGLEPFIERIAYSWFNRFAALRFMEVNNFLSHGFRVLSSREPGKNEPEILTHAAEIELPGLDSARVIELKLAGNKDAELYKMLLIAQCNELHRAMPFLFERINDETEILLPDNLLHSDSVIRKMATAIDEADWAEVEIIGWLYQFYISEKKDEVIGKTVKSEDIPAATQLFTPNWIVKYMTQNSLGRLWLEANPHSQLAANMEFYIKPAETIRETHEETRNENKIDDYSGVRGQLNPEEIKILDPACGSGHILVEAYELLKTIYTERGYISRDIPLLILEKNLFGLDIDERAAQLASFALLMKARRDDRRIFEKLNKAGRERHEEVRNKTENSVRDFRAFRGRIPQVLTIPDSSHINARDIAEMFFSREEQPGAAGVPIRDSNFLFDEMQVQPSLMMKDKESVRETHEKTRTENTLPFNAIGGQASSEGVNEQNVIDLLELFEQGKTLGSLIRIPHGFGAVVDKLEKAVEAKRAEGDFYEQVAARELEPFVRAANVLAQKYNCVIANPPYMGGNGMNGELKAFAKKEFSDSKSDLFAIFIERNFELLKPHGFNAMVTMQSWMFLSSYEKMREKILDEKTIVTMAHLGARAFVEISGEVVQTTTFVMKNEHSPELRPTFFRLVGLSELEKISALRNGEYLFTNTRQKDFKKILGSPIAYWASENLRNTFIKGESLSDISVPKVGISTTDNNKFLRFWFEIASNKFGLGFQHSKTAKDSGKKWFPFNKGGEFRKWYGNFDYVINWQDDGRDLKAFIAADPAKQVGGRIVNTEYSFQPAMTWSALTSNYFSCRKIDLGIIFGNASKSVFGLGDKEEIVMSLLNSKTANQILDLLSPTLNFEAGDVGKLPILPLDVKSKIRIKDNVNELVQTARADWDSFETSWDFKRLPIVDCALSNETNSVEECWKNWKNLCDERITRMQFLETENNCLFIEAYGLEDELSPEVPLEQITLARADAEKDTRRLLSYFLGCLMGRYSLDEEGLIYADAGNKSFDPSRYQTFPADDDGIVPVTDIEWFPQEAARQFEKFVRTVWGEALFSQNLRWIAEQLGAKAGETPTETVRRYFSTAFFKDHLQTYKKRPIYWLFSSGKQKAFEALIYLHRYNEATLPRMRHEYVLPLMSKLEAQIETLAGKADAFGVRSGGLIESADSTSEKTRLGKQRDILQKKQAELAAFDEKLRHYSDLRISLDLDDGVKVNYGKFGDLLAEVKQVAATKE